MKIKVALIEREEYANGDSRHVNLEFYVTSGGSSENRAAFLYTPQGHLKLYGLTVEAGGAFETGKSYLIDITPAG